jgi:type III secretion protein W
VPGLEALAGSPDDAEIAAKAIAEEKLAHVAEEENAVQEETQDHLKEVFEETANPLAASFATKQKSLQEQPIRVFKTEKGEEARKVIPEREVKEQASKFERRNPELKASILMLLLDKAKQCRDKDELIKLIEQFYPDPTLADEAFDFLLATTVGIFKEMVQEAKDAYNASHGREIQAGKNISEEVQKFVTLGLGTPSKLRDLYRDITGNPRDPVALFIELGDRFNYKEMRKVLSYLFHALGSDLKSQGPSIPAGMLHTLLTEVRNLQAGLGVLQFFRNRMRLVAFLFERNGLPIPQELTFESISRQFITLLQERYPAPDKVLQLARKLGISETLAKIIVFSQMRDAVREVALHQFYRSLQHRDEVYKAILDCLEQLEEELDEQLERNYTEEDTVDADQQKKQGQEQEDADQQKKGGQKQEDVEQEDGKEPKEK